MDRFDPVGEVSSELWNRVIATNLTGAMEASKIAVKQFMKQHTEGRVIEGVIINVASPVVDKPLLAGELNLPTLTRGSSS
jgi:NAD(P)-dependent dehydrogenase (short-subunit alcohol dehydrogenase family)